MPLVPGFAVANSSVAASWSNWLVMRLAAVRVKPIVATRAVSPITTPNTVSIIRTGLANMPANASSIKSNIRIPDRATVFGGPGSAGLAGRLTFSSPPVSSVS